MFETFDKDKSGTMGLDEFRALMNAWDPEGLCTSEAGITEAFETVGAVDNEIQLQQFCQWAHITFGGLDLEEYNEVLGEILDAGLLLDM